MVNVAANVLNKHAEMKRDDLPALKFSYRAKNP